MSLNGRGRRPAQATKMYPQDVVSVFVEKRFFENSKKTFSTEKLTLKVLH